MEQLVIHSKSYLVRWVNIAPDHSISWSIQPHKKSINFGVFKHAGTPNALGITTAGAAASFDTSAPTSPALTPIISNDVKPRKASVSTPTNTASLIDKLEKVGMKSIAWSGKCEADKVTMGSYDVPAGESGMYGLVFDNTHSKQLSKTVTFVLMTFPSSAPPQSLHPLHSSNAMAGVVAPNPANGIGSKITVHNSSQESLAQDPRATAMERRPSSRHGTEHTTTHGASFYTGILSKKRRKRNQGYARRFFSLDFTSGTLSYYKNRDSSALRGSIPLSLAAIGANEKSREISIDNGVEVWLLRAHRNDFPGWRAALEKAASSAALTIASDKAQGAQTAFSQPRSVTNPAEEREWEQVETLVGRVAGITDAVRRLAKDTDPKYAPAGSSPSIAKSDDGASPNSLDQGKGDYFGNMSRSPDRPSFWKRKSSAGIIRAISPGDPTNRRAVSSQQPPSNSLTVPVSPSAPIVIPKRKQQVYTLNQEESIHEHCMAVLRDLDAVVANFSSLIAESRQRRTASRPIAVSRNSYESTQSEVFFDAQDGGRPLSQLLDIGHDSDREGAPDRDGSDGGDSNSTLESEEDETQSIRSPRHATKVSTTIGPKSLTPLPHDLVQRRTTFPPSAGSPPSLIGFLRKNVGKDLSTIAMPVTANEPLSLLQRQAEQMEYSELLESAVAAPSGSCERLLYITAFAISPLSNSRSKERAIRKPFNPMLGETYELVREDKGFRFLAEKVSHRPVRVACHAEARDWSFSHSPMPVQKFWGKSAELITEGRAQVVLHKSGDLFSWVPATCSLRNIIAGEKYVEPVQTMTVLDESNGSRAIVTFKTGGMFSGRSEEVSVQCLGPSGDALPLGLVGKWTSELHFTGTGDKAGKPIWSVGSLTSEPQTHYGMTAFSATLNEITALEDGAVPPTDSRLRPDQRAHELGDIDKAERLKAALEEAQRRRRKDMETRGESWVPHWFEKEPESEGGVAGREDEVWRLKEGKDGYWSVRQAVVDIKKGQWDGIREVFEV